MTRNKFLPRETKSVRNATELRKNLTKQERHLWYDFLKLLPVHFYRQYTIEKYIVDFFCPKANLAIEIDGSQHYEENTMKYDEQRTKLLESYGIVVLRYTNRDINERFTAVCDDIKNHLNVCPGLCL